MTQVFNCDREIDAPQSLIVRLRNLADYAADGPPSPMLTDMVALMREAADALGWQPIETLPLDTPALMWAPKESLYTPETIENKPDIAKDDYRVSTRRWWAWATHWMPLPVPPR